jgi:hypothetical protein
VWLLAGLLAGAAAAGAFVLYRIETGGQFDGRARSILLAIAAIAITGLFTVPTSSGNRLTPAYIAVIALPLVAEREFADDKLIGALPFFTFESALASVLGGLALLAVLRAVRGHQGREVVDDLLRRLCVFVSYLFAYDLLLSTTFMQGSEWRRVVLFALAGLGAFVVEVVLHVIFTGRLFGGRTRHGVTSSVADAAVFASLLATGALFGLSYEAIGAWAFAVAVLPYAFTAGAFRRLSQTKGTYEQTLVALAQIPEVGGHTPIGHAARTNDLATAVAERIGVSPKDYERINYASFLHDIGRITLNEPSILRQGFTDVDLAGWGAEIVGETKYLEDVATIVRRQHEPFRSPGEVSNPDLPLASRIIKVCSAYDESVHEMGFSPLEALERIHRGTVYDFDPDVVRELREVLERRGMLNHPTSVTPG